MPSNLIHIVIKHCFCIINLLFDEGSIVGSPIASGIRYSLNNNGGSHLGTLYVQHIMVGTINNASVKGLVIIGAFTLTWE